MAMGRELGVIGEEEGEGRRGGTSKIADWRYSQRGPVQWQDEPKN